MRPTFPETVKALKVFFDGLTSVGAQDNRVKMSTTREAFGALQTINMKHVMASDRGQELPEMAVNSLISFEKGSADAEALALALEMRANYIETKNVILSTNDMIERRQKPPEVSEEQKLLVRRLRGIASQLRNER